MSGMEKRTMERFGLELPARLTRADALDNEHSESMELITSDICAGGAYFHTDVPLPVGTDVKIDIVLPIDEIKKIKTKKALVKVTGAVLRATEDGMAICFDKNFEITSIPNDN